MRLLVGFLLVFAAVLKTVELISDLTVALVHPLGRYFLPAQIGFELALGILVLSSLYWRSVRWLAAVLFAGFTGYSLYLAISSAASCGCFGPIRVSPWWTFFLDLAVVMGLLISAPSVSGQLSKELGSNYVQRSGNSRNRHYLVATAMGIAVTGAVLLVRHVDHGRVAAKVLLPSSGDLVILEPEVWIGQRLPIANSIDTDISQGTWVILLHRHDCSACKDLVSQYEQRAGGSERIALIEVPPYGTSEFRGNKDCKYGRLKENHEWFVQTPVEIRVQNGVVTAAKVYAH